MKDLENMKGYAIVVVALAIIVIMGIAILGGFSYSTRTSTTTAVNGITLAANGTATDIGTTGQYPYLQTVTSCVNATNVSDTLATTSYTVQEGDTTGGSITLTDAAAEWTGESVNCSSVSYLASSSAQTSSDTFIEGLSIFGTFMAIIVLAIVGKLIMGLFRKED